MMPVNRRFPIAQLMRACEYYFDMTGRRVSYEYAMARGVSDRPWQAERLVQLLRGRPGHVNLIPLNPLKASVVFSRYWSAAALLPLCAAGSGRILMPRVASCAAVGLRKVNRFDSIWNQRPGLPPSDQSGRLRALDEGRRRDCRDCRL